MIDQALLALAQHVAKPDADPELSVTVGDPSPRSEVTLTVLAIEADEERRNASLPRRGPDGGLVASEAPPLEPVLTVLVSAAGAGVRHLQLLSIALRRLGAVALRGDTLPEGLDLVLADLTRPDLDTLSRLWRAFEQTPRPSAMLRVVVRPATR